MNESKEPYLPKVDEIESGLDELKRISEGLDKVKEYQERELKAMKKHLGEEIAYIREKIETLKEINEGFGGNPEISEKISELEERIGANLL